METKENKKIVITRDIVKKSSGNDDEGKYMKVFTHEKTYEIRGYIENDLTISYDVSELTEEGETEVLEMHSVLENAIDYAINGVYSATLEAISTKYGVGIQDED